MLWRSPNEKKQKDSCKEIEDENDSFEIEMGEAISCEYIVKASSNMFEKKDT